MDGSKRLAPAISMISQSCFAERTRPDNYDVRMVSPAPAAFNPTPVCQCHACFHLYRNARIRKSQSVTICGGWPEHVGDAIVICPQNGTCIRSEISGERALPVPDGRGDAEVDGNGVLPTPPFWLARVITLAINLSQYVSAGMV